MDMNQECRNLAGAGEHDSGETIGMAVRRKERTRPSTSPCATGSLFCARVRSSGHAGPDRQRGLPQGDGVRETRVLPPPADGASHRRLQFPGCPRHPPPRS